eukprot:6760164-Pyramimonas_sp.AAC.1
MMLMSNIPMPATTKRPPIRHKSPVPERASPEPEPAVAASPTSAFSEPSRPRPLGWPGSPRLQASLSSPELSPAQPYPPTQFAPAPGAKGAAPGPVPGAGYLSTLLALGRPTPGVPGSSDASARPMARSMAELKARAAM